MIQIKGRSESDCHKDFMEWKEIVGAPPLERDLEVAVIDEAGIHPIAFPCRYKDAVWVNAVTRKRIEINPTHWRDWRTKAART